MVNRTLFVFIGFEAVFLTCAVFHLLLPVLTRASLSQPPTSTNVATNLLLDQCPLTASMINSFVMYTTFLTAVPAIILPRDHIFLNIHLGGIIISATTTLFIGLKIWFSTLQAHAMLAPTWHTQSTTVQSMLQSKFQCCGYTDAPLQASPFVQDSTCSSSTIAAELGSCADPFADFANTFLNLLFTMFFGFVVVDALLFLSALCLIKQRQERERYRFIDEKDEGFGWQ